MGLSYTGNNPLLFTNAVGYSLELFPPVNMIPFTISSIIAK